MNKKKSVFFLMVIMLVASCAPKVPEVSLMDQADRTACNLYLQNPDFYPEPPPGCEKPEVGQSTQSVPLQAGPSEEEPMEMVVEPEPTATFQVPSSPPDDVHAFVTYILEAIKNKNVGVFSALIQPDGQYIISHSLGLKEEIGLEDFLQDLFENSEPSCLGHDIRQVLPPNFMRVLIVVNPVMSNYVNSQHEYALWMVFAYYEAGNQWGFPQGWYLQQLVQFLEPLRFDYSCPGTQ